MEAEHAARLQNRRHQRGYLGRQKGKTQALEIRVRECERHGMIATAQLQAAARAVVEENLRLRSLLSSRGVSSTQIDEYRGMSNLSSGTPIRSDPTRVRSDRSDDNSRTDKTISFDPTLHVATQTGLASAKIAAACNRSHTVLASFSPVRDKAIEAKCSSKILQLPRVIDGLGDSPPTAKSSSDFSGDQNSQSSEPVDKTSDAERAPGDTSDETSCQVAAQVIAGMRRLDDAESLYHELGCNGMKRCMIKNTDIFEMMDG